MWSRRNFLGVSAGGFAGFALHHSFADALLPRDGSAKACIVLWMDGGPSQIDTFDPKPGRATGGTFGAIDTSAKDVRVCEHLPRVARVMDRVSLVRSMTARDQDHARAAYLMHTGYPQTAMLGHPSLGSLVAHESGAKEGVPGYVSIRSSLGFTLNPDPGPGFLGPEYGPFVIDRPEKPDETIRALGEDVDSRLELVDQLNRDFKRDDDAGNRDRRRQFLRLSRGLKDSVFAKALDLRDEKEETVAAYLGGNEKRTLDSYGFRAPASQFGYGCLVARRLVESGVKFVEVNLGGWDTHIDNFKMTGDLLRVVDPAFASLIEDLDRRGLLASTLVLWMGEFGRTPTVNAQKGRDHYPQAFSVAMAGGGIAGGRVVGETDADGVKIVREPASVPDLFATVCACFGVDPSKRHARRDTGVVKMTDGGRAIRALLD